MVKDSQECKSYDASLVASNLVQLHEHVTRTLERVEITRPGTDERCVMVSKKELECIERALEILSDTEDVRELCGKIAQLAAVTGPASSTLDA